MKQKYPIPVGTSVLLNDKGQLLLGQKANGLWECLGGKIEDELVEEGARRELKEEIGVVAIGRGIYLGYTESYGSGKNNADQRFVNHHFYWPKWQGEPRIMEPEKCQQLKWFDHHLLPDPKTMTKGTRLFSAAFCRLVESDCWGVPHIAKTHIEQVLEAMRLVSE